MRRRRAIQPRTTGIDLSCGGGIRLEFLDSIPFLQTYVHGEATMTAEELMKPEMLKDMDMRLELDYVLRWSQKMRIAGAQHPNTPLPPEMRAEVDGVLTFILNQLKRALASSKQGSYLALYLTIERLSFLDLEDYLNKVDEIFIPPTSATQSEKRFMLTGKILAYGVILRTKRSLNSRIGSRITGFLLDDRIMKGSYLAAASWYILILLDRTDMESNFPGFASDIDNFLTILNMKNEYSMRIVYKALRLGYTMNKSTIILFENFDDLGKNVLVINPEDKETLDHFIHYVAKKKLFVDFWAKFRNFSKSTQMRTFAECFVNSIKYGCELSVCASDEVLQHIFYHIKVSDKEVHGEAVRSLKAFLQIDERNDTERKYVINAMIVRKNDILGVYHIAQKPLISFLSKCKSDELDWLSDMIWNTWVLPLEVNPINIYNFLAKIAQAKNADLSLKQTILCRLTASTIGFSWDERQFMLTPPPTGKDVMKPIMTCMKNQNLPQLLNNVVQYVGSQLKKYAGQLHADEFLLYFMEHWDDRHSNEHLDFIAKSYLFSYLTTKDVESKNKFEIIKEMKVGSSEFLPTITNFFIENLETNFPFKLRALYQRILSEYPMDDTTIAMIVDSFNNVVTEIGLLYHDDDFDDDDVDDYDDIDEDRDDEEDDDEDDDEEVGANTSIDEDSSAEIAQDGQNFENLQDDIDLDDAKPEELAALDNIAINALKKQKDVKKLLDQRTRKLCSMVDQFLSNTGQYEVTHIIMLFSPLMNFITCRISDIDYAHETFFRLMKIKNLCGFGKLSYRKIIKPLLADATGYSEKQELSKKVRSMMKVGMDYLNELLILVKKKRENMKERKRRQ